MNKKVTELTDKSTILLRVVDTAPNGNICFRRLQQVTAADLHKNEVRLPKHLSKLITDWCEKKHLATSRFIDFLFDYSETASSTRLFIHAPDKSDDAPVDVIIDAWLSAHEIGDELLCELDPGDIFTNARFFGYFDLPEAESGEERMLSFRLSMQVAEETKTEEEVTLLPFVHEALIKHHREQPEKQTELVRSLLREWTENPVRLSGRIRSIPGAIKIGYLHTRNEATEEELDAYSIKDIHASFLVLDWLEKQARE